MTTMPGNNQIADCDQLVVDADLLAIREIGSFLNDVVSRSVDFDPTDLVGGMELALQELAVNIVKHAYGDASGSISMTWSTEGALGTIVVRDQGPEFDWTQANRADLEVPQVNGYGLIIIETIAESFTHERIGDDNVWTIVFSLAE